jgi:lantibiotic modifying enzyme
MTTPRAPTWTPLVAGSGVKEALAAVEAIAHDLSPAAASQEHGPALSSGMAGIALFFGYLHRSLHSGEAQEASDIWLDRAIEGLAVLSSPDASLFHGFTGVAWVAEHLAGCESLADADDPNSEIDRALGSILQRAPWRGDFDLLQGLVGWGVYALERLPRPSATQILALVIARLSECADWTTAGATWRGSGNSAPTADLGMAHGVGGVIALLARAITAGPAGPEAAMLLAAAVEGVLAGDLVARESTDGDLAWCAGTCGLSVALLLAGRACAQPEWVHQAHWLANAAARRYLDDGGGFDPALCHGTAGLFHIFHRMHHATGDPDLLNAARHWLLRTLAKRQPGVGIGGFLCRTKEADGSFGWNPRPGFLSGASGIGLALLAASSPVHPAWDRLLLLAP